jgi:hypothetical protein
MKNLCQIEPIILLKRVPFNRLPEIFERFLKVNISNIPLVKKSQSIERVGIRWNGLSGLNKVLFRKVNLIERDSSPKTEYLIAHHQRNEED